MNICAQLVGWYEAVGVVTVNGLRISVAWIGDPSKLLGDVTLTDEEADALEDSVRDVYMECLKEYDRIIGPPATGKVRLTLAGVELEFSLYWLRILMVALTS